MVVLPAEVPYGDIELDMMENEPPGFLPAGQDSVWGQVRKLYADYLQENIADALAQWYDNLDPRTVSADDLAEWEVLHAIPQGQALSDAARRNFILARMYKGAFTRTVREQIIETFITATFGPALSFSPSGFTLDASGLSLFSGASGDPKTMYRVYEDVRNFTYQVRILDSIDPDLAGLRRELRRITPAGINSDDMVAEVFETANILNYHRMILDASPIAYYRLNGVDATDESGYGNNGTFPGGNPTAIGGPGLIHASVDEDLAGNGDGAADFNGTSHYLSAPDAPHLDPAGPMAVEAWIRVDALPALSSWGTILAKGVGAGSYELYLYNSGGNGVFQWWTRDGTGAYQAGTTTPIVVGTTYHIVGVHTGTRRQIFVDGVLVVDVADTHFPAPGNAAALTIGGRGASLYFNGVIDEVAVYSRALSAEEVLAHYNTGKNIA